MTERGPLARGTHENIFLFERELRAAATHLTVRRMAETCHVLFIKADEHRKVKLSNK